MKSLILICFVLLSYFLKAQIILSSVEPQYLPAYNFFGPNYQVSNVTYTGDSISFAQFDGTNSDLGLSTGFMVASGDCSIAY